MAQISTAWVLSKPGVTAPIIGTTSLKNLEDILGKSHLRAAPLPRVQSSLTLWDMIQARWT